MSNFLSCEDIGSGFGCTVGDYVIEWRLNSRTGTCIFKTGKGSDLQIQAQHPFYNEIVQAGTLYPVAQYIYLNGEKHTSEYEEGSSYSPDLLTCFDPVEVNAATCSTVLGSDPNYNFHLTYTNNIDVSEDKSRVLTYILSPTTRYVAWEFTAYEVAEQLKVYYCTAEDSDGVLIDNFVMGTRNESGTPLQTNLYPSNYPSNYRTWNVGITLNYKYVINLTAFTYQSGDYLKIQITGAVLEPSNSNTNWQLKLQCFDSIDTTFPTINIHKIVPGTIEMIYNEEGELYPCVYELRYTPVETPISIDKVTSPYWLIRYTNIIPTRSEYGVISNVALSSPIRIGLEWRENFINSWVSYQGGENTCYNYAEGDIEALENNTSYLQITLSNVNDYNKWVADFTRIQATAEFIQWQSFTDDDFRYYSYKYYIPFKFAESCGDTGVYNVLNFWAGSTIEFDAPNKIIKIYHPTLVNNTVNVECNDCYEHVNTIISFYNTSKNWTPPAAHTHVGYVNPVGFLKGSSIEDHDTVSTDNTSFLITSALINNITDLTAIGFCLEGNDYKLYRMYDKVTLTDPSTHESRLNSWKLERQVRMRTDNCVDTDWETVEESVYTTTTTEAPATTTTTTEIVTTTTTTIP